MAHILRFSHVVRNPNYDSITYHWVRLLVLLSVRCCHHLLLSGCLLLLLRLAELIVLADGFCSSGRSEDIYLLHASNIGQYIRSSIVLMIGRRSSWKAYSDHTIARLLTHSCMSVSCLLLGCCCGGCILSCLSYTSRCCLVALQLLTKGSRIFICSLHVAIEDVIGRGWLVLLLLEMLESWSHLQTLLKIEECGVFET